MRRAGTQQEGAARRGFENEIERNGVEQERRGVRAENGRMIAAARRIGDGDRWMVGGLTSPGSTVRRLTSVRGEFSADSDNVPEFSTFVSHRFSRRDFLHPISRSSRKIARGKSRNRTRRRGTDVRAHRSFVDGAVAEGMPRKRRPRDGMSFPDDLVRRAILTNPDLLASTPWYRLFENDFWGTPLTERGSHGSYRPLCVATFRLNHFLGGLEPWGYHLVNVALHAACTVLVVKVARKVLPGRSNLAHAITGFLFAVHPIHSEAVAGIVGRADLLACFLTLISFLTYSAHCNRTRPSFPLLLALVSSTLATLAKETGISSLALCLLWELCRGEPSRKCVMPYLSIVEFQGNCSVFTRGRSVGILSGGLALLALGRLKLAGSRPEFASADNPTARHPSRLTRSLTFLYLPAASARMLLCPSTLSFDWSMDAVPRITSPFDLRNLDNAGVNGVNVGSRQTTATAVAISLGFLVFPFLPASNLFFYVGFVIAERILYLPSVGACLAVGAAVSGCYRIARRNGSRTRGRAVLLGTAILIGMLGRADADALAYSSDDASVLILTLPQVLLSFLFNSLHLTAAINITQVAKCSVQTALLKYCIIALERARKQRNDGRAYLDRDNSQVIAARIIINTESVRPYGNLGSILSEQGRVTEAEEAFVQALRYRPNMADVHYNLLSKNGPERTAESPSIGAHHLSTLHLLKVGKDVEACQAVESISLPTLCTLLISRLRSG
ncbi:hypothetical protein ALC53_10957 [Atta colombica]|uniref:dolichyl-phosphate-mannose--protein mannosyltransferase n=1 Tax=Atta colombica TaxID=520822 RepID=A0A195B1Y6_9HYME|nr:hypothetical protein ALC53_10957 [Atta colombica]